MNARTEVREVTFKDDLVEYLLNIVDATRNHGGFEVGVSTRAALSFYRACQAKAVTEDRDFVSPDDIKSLAVPVLAHRVQASGLLQGGSDRGLIESQIKELLEQVSVPV